MATPRRIPLVVILSLLVTSFTSAAAEEESATPGQSAETALKSKGRAITLRLREKPLKVVTDHLSSVTGINIKLKEEALARLPVTLDLEGVSWETVLDWVCKKHDLRVDRDLAKQKILFIWRPKKVTLDYRDADIRTVIWSIAEQADLSVVIDPVVKGNVTATIKDRPWDEALESVTKALGYVVVRHQPKGWRIKSK